MRTVEQLGLAGLALALSACRPIGVAGDEANGQDTDCMGASCAPTSGTSGPDGSGSGNGDETAGGGQDEGDDESGETGEPECCEGDNFLHLASGHGSEVVGMDFDGSRIYTCGGFGVVIDDVLDPEQPAMVAAGAPRCQNLAIGKLRDDDVQIFYLAHHGDSWIDTPFLGTYQIDADDNMEEYNFNSDASLLYEGLTWRDDHLYVTAHQDGLLIYTTDDDGVPTLLTQLGGFTNAAEIALAGDYAYIADGPAGVRVVDISDPGSPQILETIETPGLPRDISWDAQRLYVSLGGDGLAVYSTTTPSSPEFVTVIESSGSVQAAQAEGELLAVAAWSHTAVYSTETFDLLATEKVKPYPAFEQDLAIAIDGDHVFTGEWSGMHVLEYVNGLEAPDAWIALEMLSFSPDEEDDRVVIIENRGQLDLEISDVEIEDSGYWVDANTPITVPPGEKRAIEIGLLPPADGELAHLVLSTNDPDIYHHTYEVPLVAADSQSLDVGDKVDESWGFLAGGDVQNLQGQVTVLAYFALF